MKSFLLLILSLMITGTTNTSSLIDTIIQMKNSKTTISCDKKKSEVMFFCKENGSICEDILSTKSSPKSNGSFTLTETSSSFNMSISNVSSEHAGVYWCGVEGEKQTSDIFRFNLLTHIMKVSLKYDSPTVGQNLTYWCIYPEGTTIKFICKGEDPSICIQIVSTAQSNAEKFSMMDDKVKRNITITVRNVTTEDTGTYWCGAERNDSKQITNVQYFVYLMLYLFAVPPTTLNSSTISTSTRPVPTSASSTQSTTASAHSDGEKVFLKPTAAGDGAYEEIRERLQKPGSGTALSTIYVTVNAPTNPSASQHYSTVNFPNSSGEASGDTYSTVWDSSHSPTHSAVNHPSRLSEDPFYSTVNNPQQH
uniref:Ig-like domain-containing protein n=1 Tax=Sander lucioperca TaxID=283035 RepID=A0A8C9YJI6_SANLU